MNIRVSNYRDEDSSWEKIAILKDGSVRIEVVNSGLETVVYLEPIEVTKITGLKLVHDGGGGQGESYVGPVIV